MVRLRALPTSTITALERPPPSEPTAANERPSGDQPCGAAITGLPLLPRFRRGRRRPLGRGMPTTRVVARSAARIAGPAPAGCGLAAGPSRTVCTTEYSGARGRFDES